MGQIGEKLAAMLGVSENMQENADPAKAQENPENTDTGAKEQNPAEAAGNQETDQHEEGTETQKEEQTLEQRRINAARRREKDRKADIDAAMKKQREKDEAEMQEFFQSSGLKNTFTGEPITNMEEYREFQKMFHRDAADKDLASGKITREALNQVIDDNPTMQALKKLADNQQDPQDDGGTEQTEEPEQEDETAGMWDEMPAAMEKEFEEIKKADPTYQDMSPEQIFNAIMADEKLAPTFQNAIMKENKTFNEAFQDAYKVANFDKAVAQQAKGAAEAEARKQRGKHHLTPDGFTRGAGAPSLSQKELAMARRWNPGMTDAEIQDAYTRDQQRGVTKY